MYVLEALSALAALAAVTADMHYRLPDTRSVKQYANATFETGIINATAGAEVVLCGHKSGGVKHVFVFFVPGAHATVEDLLKDVDAFHGGSHQPHVPRESIWLLDMNYTLAQLMQTRVKVPSNSTNVSYNHLLMWSDFYDAHWNSYGNMWSHHSALIRRTSEVNGICFMLTDLHTDDAGDYIFVTALTNGTVFVKMYQLYVTVPVVSVEVSVQVRKEHDVCLVKATCTASGLRSAVSMTFTDTHSSQTLTLTSAHYYNTNHRIIQSDVTSRVQCSRMSATFDTALTEDELLDYEYLELIVFYCSVTSGGHTQVAEVDVETPCADIMGVEKAPSTPRPTPTPQVPRSTRAPGTLQTTHPPDAIPNVTTPTPLPPPAPAPSPPPAPGTPVTISVSLVLLVVVVAAAIVFCCAKNRECVVRALRNCWYCMRGYAAAAARQVARCVSAAVARCRRQAHIRHARLKDVDNDTCAFVGEDMTQG